MMATDLTHAAHGCLLGTAVGDAMGLPCEGLTRRRQPRLFPSLDHPRLVCGRGMVSDDTDHARMAAESLAASGGEPHAFAADLGRRMRGWFLALPPGVGLATVKACLRLLAGFGPERSGVFSAGNGPAMRAPILGVAASDDLPALAVLVRASTRITHTDPKAEWGAMAAALAAAMSARSERPVAPEEFVEALAGVLPPAAGEFLALIRLAAASAGRGESADAFADSLGLSAGISGYTYHTVPAVIQTWLRRQEDYAGGVTEMIRCGGDADTTAAILGGIIGARVGAAGIPVAWRDRVVHWPYSEGYYAGLAEALAAGETAAFRRPFYQVALRNAVQLAIVLTHGFRRLAPPY